MVDLVLLPKIYNTRSVELVVEQPREFHGPEGRERSIAGALTEGR
jgi:hypothetical protein